MSDTYHPRHLSAALAAYRGQLPVVTVLGARQVGKSTWLARELVGWERVDLEAPESQELVGADPALYLRDHPGRTWFDEAQRIGGLFAALRVSVDGDRTPGRYVLSGSASPALVQHVSESLAGRTGVLELLPFTTAEASRREPSRFLELLLEARSASDIVAALRDREPAPDAQVLDRWVRGGIPEPWLLGDDPAARSRWYESYIRLVSERDLRLMGVDLGAVRLRRVLRMLAARHGAVVNVSGLARDLGVAHRMMTRLLDVLEGAHLWRRVPPFFRNIGKRLVKQPRGYLADSGLLHHLLGVPGLDDLLIHPTLGASWEGFVLDELRAAAQRVEPRPELSFWRTHQGAEVDVVIERGALVRPVEIKHTSRVGPMERRGLRSFLDAHPDAPFGVLVTRGEHLARVEERVAVVPIDRIV